MTKSASGSCSRRLTTRPPGYVIRLRRQLAVRTIFNFLGPLTNPAGATRQLIGVSDPAYLEDDGRRAGAARTKHALLVASEDGLDELTSRHARWWSRSSALSSGGTRSRLRVGLHRAPAEHPRRDAGGERGDRAGDLRRRVRGAPGSRRCRMPGPRSTPAAGRRRSRRECGRASVQLTTAPRLRRSSGSCGEPASSRRESSRSIVAATRKEVARRREIVPPASLEEAGAARRAEDEPTRGFAEALARPACP